MLTGNPARPMTASRPPNPPPTIMTRWRSPLPITVEQGRSAELKAGLFIAASRLARAICIRTAQLARKFLPVLHQGGAPALPNCCVHLLILHVAWHGSAGELWE